MEMDHSVDDIIDKICEIESTVTQMMDMAEGRQRALAEQMETRKKQYDEKLFEEALKTLEDIKTDLNAKKEDELERLKKETEEKGRALKLKYEDNKEKWVDEIVESIVRV